MGGSPARVLPGGEISPPTARPLLEGMGERFTCPRLVFLLGVILLFVILLWSRFGSRRSSSLVATAAAPLAKKVRMSAAMGIQVYYSADTKQLMPTVTAADVATAAPMAPEQVAEFFPHGVPDGFLPMICGTYTATAPVPEMKEPVAAVAVADGAKKEKKKKSSKKVKTSKKKKGCC
ncbi:unnamed protein product [Prorocentrum cordatum]|uniref:Uncharacterized protein n=1 Tax=Prorocentrum cordatum TaxID=2364126 RepID=A0ABN9RTQ1_9DINO|nr:unnamed protein product [Polarella glacialis]